MNTTDLTHYCPVCRFGCIGRCDEHCEEIAQRITRGLTRGVDTDRSHGPETEHTARRSYWRASQGPTCEPYVRRGELEEA